MSFHRWLIACVSLNCFFLRQESTATWNLFMNKTETKRLLGVRNEVFYVQNGTVNDYALTFSVPLKNLIKNIYFDWNSVSKKELYYKMSVSASNPLAIDAPSLSISSSGKIPSQTSTFGVRLACSGQVSAEVDVRILLNVTSATAANLTTIEIRRKKTCLQGVGQALLEEKDDLHFYDYKSEERELETVLSGNAVLIVIGVTTGCILIVSVLVILFYKVSKGHRQGHLSTKYHLSQTNCTRIDTKDKNSNGNVCAASYTRSLLSGFRSPSLLVSAPTSGIDHRTLFGSTIVGRGCHVSLVRPLLEGCAGRFYWGVLQSEAGDPLQQVLVKTIRDSVDVNDEERQQILDQVRSLKDCHHPNIRPMLATVSDPFTDSFPLIIYQFTNDNNLKVYLQNSRTTESPSLFQLIQMVFGICDGLLYLHRCQILHRDVATRNCLVDDRLTVRLTDVALAPDFFPCDYQESSEHGDPLPVRWLPVETLTSGIYQAASEVWSFAVTAWEVMTLAEQPYSDIEAHLLLDHLSKGLRLQRPINCPAEMYGMMRSCWQSTPESRPNLDQLQATVEQLYANVGQFI